MKLRELKESIKQNSLDFNTLIFVYTDNKYLVNSYISEIVRVKGLETFKVENLQELYSQFELSNSFFEDTDNTLYIVEVDKLQEFEVIDNHSVIVICKEIDKSLKETLKEFIVDFPKLDKWQIEDYTKVMLPGLSDEERKWLCTITNYDIFRLSEEIDKIRIFNKDDQEKIFLLLNKESCYEDLTELNIFNLVNAIVKRNKDEVLKILKSIKVIDVEPVGLVTLLSKQFKNLLSIQSNPRVTFDELGISQKQFNAIKYNRGKYNLNELIDIYQLLTSIDYRLKSGFIDNNQIIDYVICNIL